MQIKFLNWDKYNKRQKDIKRPFWVAISNDLFLDPWFSDLSDKEKLTHLWLLFEASKQNKYGDVFVSEKLFTQITGFNTQVLHSTIDKLLKSKAAAEWRQDGGSFTTATEQNRTEQEDMVCPAGQTENANEELLNQIYREYPKRKGNQNKLLGYKKLKPLVKTFGVDKILIAVKNYRSHCESEKIIGTALVKQFGNFFDALGDWQHWLEEKQKPKVTSLGFEFKR